MKAELLDKEVLAMYDVRGIQSYIFKSNVDQGDYRSFEDRRKNCDRWP